MQTLANGRVEILTRPDDIAGAMKDTLYLVTIFSFFLIFGAYANSESQSGSQSERAPAESRSSTEGLVDVCQIGDGVRPPLKIENDPIACSLRGGFLIQRRFQNQDLPTYVLPWNTP